MSTPFEPQGAFLGLEPVDSDPANSRYAVLPIPYEGTVTFRLGTINGPDAIIEASQQVELFDEELLGEFFQAGVTTCPAIGSADSPEAQDRLVYEAARELMAAGKFVLSLGGEHSVTYPLVRAAAEQHGEISVLQIDAHADLRESYEGTIYSHASVMRRVLEVTGRVAQVGIRNFSLGEFEQCHEQVKRFITPAVMADDPNWIDRTLSLLGDKVYITVDIDGLDPAIAPGTGTPEPGGMSWREITSLLRRVCREREIVSADIMEVRPIPPNHVTEFLAARLAYKLIAYTQINKF